MFLEKLRAKHCGLEMRTPISIPPAAMEGPAAQSVETYIDKLMSFVDAGASKVSIQYTCPENIVNYPKGKEPILRWGSVDDSSLIAKNFRYLFIIADEYAIMGRKDTGKRIIDGLKKRVPPGVIVQADVVGKGSDPESWSSIAKEFEDAGADCIELDTSCPFFAFHKEPRWAALIREGFPNQQIADSDEALPPVIEAVAKKLTVPFGWKMTPETGWPRFLYLAKETTDKGANWVTCTNNPLMFTPIDIYNDGKPDEKLFPGGTANTMAGAVGYGRAIGRKTVAAIRHWVPKAGIQAVIGITKPEYAVDYLMLGADIIELSSGLWFYGKDFITKTVKFIERFMDDYGYDSIDELRGRALEHTEWDATKYNYRYGELVAKVDEEMCTGCRRCIGTVCFAMSMDDGKAKVNEVLCGGCGLCTQTCPVGAVILVERAKPKELDIARGIPAIK